MSLCICPDRIVKLVDPELPEGERGERPAHSSFDVAFNALDRKLVGLFWLCSWVFL
jgi:hypothetical protein